MKKTTVSISLHTILLTIGLLLGLLFVFAIREILVGIFLAVIVMSALNPAVSWLEARKVPRPVSIFSFYIVLISALVILFAFVVPPLTKEVGYLVGALELPALPAEFWELKFDLQAVGSALTQFQSSFGSIFGIVSSTFSTVLFVFTTLVMGFYLLLDRKNLHKYITWYTDNPKHTATARLYLDRMEKDLGSWVRGQLILMFVIGNVTFIILTLLGVPYALPLAVLAGLLEILPNIGPTIAAVPAIAVAFLLINPTMGLIVLGAYVAIQQVENNLLVPHIMRAAVDVPALTTILLILIGFKLGGVAGALLSVPTFLLLRILFTMWKEQRVSLPSEA